MSTRMLLRVSSRILSLPTTTSSTYTLTAPTDCVPHNHTPPARQCIQSYPIMSVDEMINELEICI